MNTRKRRAQRFYHNLDVRRALVASAPFWMAAAASQGVSAATFNATDTASLRTAINSANGGTTNDEVVLASGTYNLTGAALENANASGDLDITKAMGDLVIRPATGATVIIDAGGNDRAFHINAGAGVNVRIEGITIRSGFATDDGTAAGEAHGGGILLEQGNLSLDGVTLQDNVAQGEDGASGNATGFSTTTPGGNGNHGFGGGIYIAGGIVQILGCTLSGNFAQGGLGGAGADGLDTAASSFVTGGIGGAAGNGGNGRGGAIYLAGGTADITASTLSGNAAFGGTGGAGGEGGEGSVTISGSTLVGFGGTGGSGGFGGAAEGGGIFAGSGQVTITSTTIVQNSAGGGHGGAGGTGGRGAALAPGFLCVGFGGDAGDGGAGGAGSGGAVMAAGANVAIDSSTIRDGDATGGTGGAGGTGGFAEAASATSTNAALAGAGGIGGNGAAGQGGGLYVSAGAIDVINSTFSANTAGGSDGGAGGAGGDASGTTLAVGGPGGDGGNGADGEGGAIFIEGGTLAIANSTIAAGAATAGGAGLGGPAGTGTTASSAGLAGLPGAAMGGGLMVVSGAVSIDSSIIADNTAATSADIDGAVTVGASLIESAGGATITPGTGANVTGQDPVLGPLQNNGGPTDTHAIDTASPARDSGSNPLLLTADQRGYSRDDGGGVDMGAYEFGAAPPITASPAVSDPAATATVDAPDYMIQGSAVADSLVRIYTDDNDNGIVDGADAVVGQLQLMGGGTSYSIVVPLAQDAPNNFVVTAEFAPSQESVPTDVPTVVEDSTPPPAPVITDPAAAIGHMGATYDIQGTAESDSLVRVFTDLNNNGVVDGGDTEVGNQQLTGGGTAFSIATPLTVTSANNFVVTAEDARMLESAPADVPTITETTPPPINPPVITAPAAQVTLNRQNFTITGTAQADSLVRIYRDANNNGQIDPGDSVVGQQQLAGGGTDFGISVPLIQNAANDFLATAEDGAMNESFPANVPTIIDDNSSTGSTTGGSDGSSCQSGSRKGPLALLAAVFAAGAAVLRRRSRAAG